MRLKNNYLSTKFLSLLLSVSLCCISNFGLAQTQLASITVYGIEAKKLFNYLTGPKVKSDAAMSKQYLQGLNVVCRYVSAPIARHEKEIPYADPTRYTCTINFDKNGLALPSKMLSE